jgi:acyl-CoA thioesterase-2
MLQALTLRPQPGAADTFMATSIKMPHDRVFGGQVLAQTLIAASATVASSRPVHSMHGYFLRPGDDTQPIEYSVDRIHDGRSFSTRRTQGLQKGVPIFSMIASFQEVVVGLDHAEPMPTGIPDPESLPEPAELFAELNHPRASYWAAQRPFDIRYINGPIYVDVPGPNVAHQAVWMRCLDRLPDDASLHRAALAYASDYTVLESIYRRHGVPWATEGLRAASLDHAMWFHRPFRADQWHLYDQHAISTSNSRGLAGGSIFTQDGHLAVTVVQEGLIRVRPNE